MHNDPTGSGSQPLASLGSPSFDDRLSVAGLHADKESMGTGTFDVARLEGSFAHNTIPFMQIIFLI